MRSYTKRICMAGCLSRVLGLNPKPKSCLRGGRMFVSSCLRQWGLLGVSISKTVWVESARSQTLKLLPHKPLGRRHIPSSFLTAHLLQLLQPLGKSGPRGYSCPCTSLPDEASGPCNRWGAVMPSRQLRNGVQVLPNRPCIMPLGQSNPHGKNSNPCMGVRTSRFDHATGTIQKCRQSLISGTYRI